MLNKFHQGDWQSARDQASSTHRWLLVNIQDAKEFQCQVWHIILQSDQHSHLEEYNANDDNVSAPIESNTNHKDVDKEHTVDSFEVDDFIAILCQVLNRDLWSNPGVKAIISEHFIFWQQYKVGVIVCLSLLGQNGQMGTVSSAVTFLLYF